MDKKIKNQEERIKDLESKNINIFNSNKNLDEIAMGKDRSTTVMIRNILNKYADTILKDAFIEFKG